MIKTIQYNGKPVAYRVTGQGRPVVLLHGFAEDGEVWQLQAAYLEKSFRLIIPDLPGSGLSAQADEVSMEALADAVYAVLAAENITATVITGHSMGGYVTLAFAEKYPAMLQAFGLFHSTAFADSEEKKAARRKSIGFMQTHGTNEFLRQATPGLFSEDFKSGNQQVVTKLIEQYSSFSEASLAAYYEAMINRPDRTHVLATFRRPVLFIIGKHDNAVPLTGILQQSHLPTISYIHILHRSGHMGMYEEPDKCNHLLDKFLQDACL